MDKDDFMVMAYGALDELQAHLGMARALAGQEKMASMIYSVQQDLFVACSELASKPAALFSLQRRIDQDDVMKLETWIHRLTARSGLPARFVTPGRSQASAAMHLARTVCRRGERRVVNINRQVKAYDDLIAYLNRLSDLLFVMAWTLEVRAIVEEVVRDIVVLASQEGSQS